MIITNGCDALYTLSVLSDYQIRPSKVEEERGEVGERGEGGGGGGGGGEERGA